MNYMIERDKQAMWCICCMSHILWVGDHRWLPLAIEFIVPFLRLLGIRIDNVGRNVIITLRLLVFRVDDLLLINPVRRLGVSRVVSGLLREVPTVHNAARCLLFVIKEHLGSDGEE